MRRFRDLSIKSRLYGLAGVSTVGLAVVRGLAVYLLQTYSIKGPVYQRTVRYKDFVVEITPPAMFAGPSYWILWELESETDPDEIRRQTALFAAREKLLEEHY